EGWSPVGLKSAFSRNSMAPRLKARVAVASAGRKHFSLINGAAAAIASSAAPGGCSAGAFSIVMQYRTLGKTGLRVSALAFGGSSLGSAFRAIDEAEGIRAVHVAIEQGINLIDTAPYYGATTAETVLGKALRTAPRDKYYLATKVARYGPEP